MSDDGYRFTGFPEGRVATIALPEAVFTELVPHLQEPDVLRVVLLVLYRLATVRSDGAPWITDSDLARDAVIAATLAGPDFDTRLQEALDAAVTHRVLLRSPWTRPDGTTELRYFANSPRGRASVAAMERGTDLVRAEVAERPNIFTLYEQNVGPLTALLAEDLMDAEATFPADWIEDAFREAVRLNKRSWKYILAILDRWQTEGRDEVARGTDGGAGERARDRDAEARRYIEEAYDSIVRH